MSLPIPFPSVSNPAIARRALLPSFSFLEPARWPAEPTLRDVFDFYLQDPTRPHTPWAVYGYGHLVELVESAFGADLPLTALDRTACRTFLEILRLMPANYARRLPGSASPTPWRSAIAATDGRACVPPPSTPTCASSEGF